MKRILFLMCSFALLSHAGAHASGAGKPGNNGSNPQPAATSNMNAGGAAAGAQPAMPPQLMAMLAAMRAFSMAQAQNHGGANPQAAGGAAAGAQARILPMISVVVVELSSAAADDSAEADGSAAAISAASEIHQLNCPTPTGKTSRRCGNHKHFFPKN